MWLACSAARSSTTCRSTTHSRRRIQQQPVVSQCGRAFSKNGQSGTTFAPSLRCFPLRSSSWCCACGFDLLWSEQQQGATDERAHVHTLFTVDRGDTLFFCS